MKLSRRLLRAALSLGVVTAGLAAAPVSANATAKAPAPVSPTAVSSQAEPGRVYPKSTYIGFAAVNVTTGQRVWSGLSTGPAWSTAKLIVVVTVLRKQRAIPITYAVRADISSALRYSDNAAAIRLHQKLIGVCGGTEQGAAQCMIETLRAGGAGTTQVSTSFNGRTDAVTHWGQTSWSAQEQSLWLANLYRGRIIGPNAGNLVFTNMAQVTSSQRWGLGQAGATYFKGGWGANAPVTVRQVGLVKKNGQWWSIAILLTSSVPGAYNHYDTLTDYASRVVGCLPARAGKYSGCY
jgi:hypothetical protein